MTLITRLAEAEDADAIRSLVRASYALYLERMDREPAPMAADYPALISQQFITVMQRNNQIVSILVCYPRDDALHVENVAVDPACQGQGIGKLLMNHAEQLARAQNFNRLELYTNEVMRENIAFYEILGFQISDQGIQDGYARIFFEKKLKKF